MLVDVKVFPKSSKNEVRFDCEPFRVYVHEAAIDGKANKAVCELLAKHFKIAKSNVSVKYGIKSKFKTININL